MSHNAKPQHAAPSLTPAQATSEIRLTGELEAPERMDSKDEQAQR